MVETANRGERLANKVGRNERCPCGSGRKYKQCCEGKRMPTKGSLALGLVLGGVGLAAAITAGIYGGLGAGFGAGFGAALVIGIFFVVRRPPPATGNRSGASSINFGR